MMLTCFGSASKIVPVCLWHWMANHNPRSCSDTLVEGAGARSGSVTVDANGCPLAVLARVART
jgi:hypothetical protein